MNELIVHLNTINPKQDNNISNMSTRKTAKAKNKKKTALPLPDKHIRTKRNEKSSVHSFYISVWQFSVLKFQCIASQV